MRVGELLEKRRADWQELELLCDRQSAVRSKLRNGESVARMASLYRGACSDLAMAEFYQLPPVTVEFLHRLVAKAHHQLYRSRRFEWDKWGQIVSVDIPRAIFTDPCVHVAAIIFFCLFSLAAILAESEDTFPDFAERMVGTAQLEGLEEMYEQPINGNFDHYITMAAFYIWHNTGIGLACFAKGVLIIPCLIELAYQATTLGVCFGYMARDSIDSDGAGGHFFEFVTAHGPFELTAIALSAAAGLRLGVGLIATAGLRRLDSMRKHAIKALPIMSVSVALFFFAALTEGFISPSPLPYVVKALWAIFSSTGMLYYFVVLGYPTKNRYGT
jgi:uncharacterized membrane protein SpoIIM required for sporulation